MIRLVAAVALALAPPHAGVVVPGQSLGGVRPGMTQAQVRARWGSEFGRCRGCLAPTWFYNEQDFRPQGLGVSFHRGRVESVFTVWQPEGWHTTKNLLLGDQATRVTDLYGPLERVECGDYSTLRQRRGGVDTLFFVLNEQVYGFAVASAGAPACLGST